MVDACVEHWDVCVSRRISVSCHGECLKTGRLSAIFGEKAWYLNNFLG